jgi:ribosomal protein L29
VQRAVLPDRILRRQEIDGFARKGLHMRFRLPSMNYRPEDDLERDVPVKFLEYITFGMLFTIGLIAVASVMSWDLIVKAFGHGVAINGTVIIIGIAGISRALWYNAKLWKTGNYLKKIDALRDREEPVSDGEMKYFRGALKTEASVLDTKQMADLLENLPSMRHLNLTDNDARLIKSKLGFRIGLMRSNTSFFAGILVMLGLLGTFVGLLETIDSVGVAMLGMSKIGGEDPSAMSGFLQDISAPLQGMGIAFSASLFGLTGSLMTSFINFLSGGVHDRFIERVSRWIDDRIPSPSQAARKAQGNPKVAGSDELKAWLAGFVQTALETNRRIESLVATIADQLKQTQANNRATRALLTLEKEHAEELKEVRRSLARGISVVRKEINDRAVEINRSARLRAGVPMVEAALAASNSTASFTPGVERSLQDSHSQLSSLVDELQNLLDSQDIMQSFRNRMTENDTEGLPPSFRHNTADSPAGANQERSPE